MFTCFTSQTTSRGWNKWDIYNRSSILIRAVGTRNVPCRTNKHFSEDPDSCLPQNSLCMQRFLVFRKYYYVDQTKGGEMGEACSEHVRDKKCISNFCHKTWRKNVRLYTWNWLVIPSHDWDKFWLKFTLRCYGPERRSALSAPACSITCWRCNRKALCK